MTAAARATGLEVTDLSVAFATRDGVRPVLDRVSLACPPGRTLGLVGESGSGKTTFGRALGRSLGPGAIVSGRVRVDGVAVDELDPRRLRDWRRSALAVVHQDAGASLDPTMRVGAQLREVLALQGVDRAARAGQAGDLLTRVGLPAAAAQRYPHELSGGQQQRVVIAAALAGRPRLLLLDEPTTGLDASVEADVLELIDELRAELDCAVVFISHDLGLVAQRCDDVAVLYAGRVVEHGAAAAVLRRPTHPYTAGLLASAPELGVPRSARRLAVLPGRPATAANGAGCDFAPRCALRTAECVSQAPALRPVGGSLVRCHHAERVTPPVPRPGGAASRPGAPLLELRGIRRSYGTTVAVDGVDLTVRAGEVLGLVGESGSGKTTLARAIVGLGPQGRAAQGEIRLDGAQVADSFRRRPRAVLRRMQMVFQNPDSTLNPSHTVARTLSRAVRALAGPRPVRELAADLQVEPALLSARPATLSGGQKQRVAIARAFAGDAQLVVLDEPVSALDVSVQAGVLELLAETAERERTAYLFVSHDLAVISYLAGRVAVMYRGQLVETGATADVIDGPHHPYTARLIRAANRREHERTTADPESTALETEPAVPQPTVGCRYADRCPLRHEPCLTDAPPVRVLDGEHAVRCHLPADRLPRTPQRRTA